MLPREKSSPRAVQTPEVGLDLFQVVQAILKVRNAFDVTQPAQDAALASLGDAGEISRRRQATTAARGQLVEIVRSLGLPFADPPVANFVYVEAGGDARELFERLLREGVIVRPLGPFGAPNGIRVTVGTEDEIALVDEALARVLAVSPTR